jgi:uncharacterized protein (DUF1501 family)
VRVNGDSGCDHGTASVAFLAGGALAGGRIVADWPGLKAGNLYENRDLEPTVDLRSVVKGMLAEHLGISTILLSSQVFPDTISVYPMKGLIAA